MRLFPNVFIRFAGFSLSLTPRPAGWRPRSSGALSICSLFTARCSHLFCSAACFSVPDALRHEAAGPQRRLQTGKLHGIFRYRALCFCHLLHVCSVCPFLSSFLLLLFPLLHPAGHQLTPPSYITPWCCQRFPPVKRESWCGSGSGLSPESTLTSGS